MSVMLFVDDARPTDQQAASDTDCLPACLPTQYAQLSLGRDCRWRLVQACQLICWLPTFNTTSSRQTVQLGAWFKLLSPSQASDSSPRLGPLFRGSPFRSSSLGCSAPSISLIEH
jgi:hypothetical protein